MPLLSYRIVSKNSVSSVTAASEPFMITPMIAIGSMRVFFISAIIPNTKPGIANMKVDAASEPPSVGENSDDVPFSDMNSEIIPDIAENRDKIPVTNETMVNAFAMPEALFGCAP